MASKSVSSGKPNRFLELEGLRGVAAVVVVVYHNLLAFYALAFLGTGSGFSVGQNMRYEDNLYGNPIMVFLSGTFAVAIFFVLSGFVLSIGFFQTGKLEIIKKLAAKRYLRLMIPALVSVLIACLVMSIGLGHTGQAAALTHSGWLASSWNFVPNVFNAMSDGIANIFVQGTNQYNGALWTMTTEFFGSFIVFAFLALFSGSPIRRLLSVVLLIITFNTWFMAFIAGMIIADLYANGYLKQIRRGKSLAVLLIAGLFLAGYPYGSVQGSIYRYLTIPGLEMKWNIFYLTIGAVILVGCVLAATQLAKVFSHPRISWLGRYTFSLYLVHLTILYSFTVFVFVVLRSHVGLGFNTSALLSLASSIPVIVWATYMFEKYVDAKAINFSSFVARLILGEQRLSTDFHLAYQNAYQKTVQLITMRRGGLVEDELTD